MERTKQCARFVEGVHLGKPSGVPEAERKKEERRWQLREQTSQTFTRATRAQELQADAGDEREVGRRLDAQIPQRSAEQVDFEVQGWAQLWTVAPAAAPAAAPMEVPQEPPPTYDRDEEADEVCLQDALREAQITAEKLQQQAVTFRMDRDGASADDARTSVAQSKGIDIGLLLGVTPEDIKTIADRKRKGERATFPSVLKKKK